MSKKIVIGIIIVIIVAGLGYLISQLRFVPEEVTTEGGKDCVYNSDCVVFGETGDCNCGCYYINNLPSSTGGDCFCKEPDSCKCTDGVCEGVFKEEQIIETKNGENFSIALEANPTTGYEWQIDFDPDYIELVQRNYIPDSPELVGSGGGEIFEFLAKELGITDIVFSYLRSWEEEEEPIEEKTFQIIIE